MKIAGIIAEYHPFHNGHAWQIGRLREMGWDAVVCVMSTGAVQRGELELLPARLRARAALLGGADLVISLPAPYACKSAEGFAQAGVWLLEALGCVDTLCFGTEDADAETLAQAARVLEGAAFRAKLREKLDAGLPLPAARSQAAEELLPGAGALLSRPNQILGADYCCALLHLKSRMQPLALRRIGRGHDEPGAVQRDGRRYASASQLRAALQQGALLHLKSRMQPLALRRIGRGHDEPGAVQRDGRRYASASQLRAALQQGGAQMLEACVPEACFPIYCRAQQQGLLLDHRAVSLAVLSRLRAMPPAGFAAVRGAGEGLAERLYAASRRAVCLDSLLEDLKTKRYPTARLRRLILDAALGYTDTLPARPPYLHILGATERGRELLGRAAPCLPMGAGLAKLARADEACGAVARAEAAAQDLAALCRQSPQPCGQAFTGKFVLQKVQQA